MNGVTDVAVDGFSVTGGLGAGVSIDTGSSNVCLRNCTVMRNGTGWPGAGVWVYESSNVLIEDSEFSYHNLYDPSGVVQIIRSSAIITGCTMRRNLGSGIYSYGSVIEVERCRLVENYAFEGGGIHCSSEDGEAIITNCLIAKNKATQSGGGIHLYGQANAVITNCSVAGNSCGNSFHGGGGARVVQSPATFVNTVFAGNNLHAITEANNQVEPVITNCLFWDHPDGVFSHETFGSIAEVEGPGGLNALMATADGNIAADPLFVNPGKGNYHLSIGSPCIDAGTQVGAAIADLDGETRPVDVPGVGGEGPSASYDIGMDEWVDSENDGMPDWWETENGLWVGVDDAAVDDDGDALTNEEEYRHGTDPGLADSDGDGRPDGQEIADGSDPAGRPVRAPVYVSPHGNNSTGASWTTALHSIADAVAQAAAEDKDVWVASATYVISAPLQLEDGVALYGGFAASGTPGFAERDPKAHPTVIDGEGTASRLIEGAGVTDILIAGFTIQSGGGIYCHSGCIGVDLANCVIRRNRANDGSAAYFHDSHFISVDDCLFEHNWADDNGTLSLTQSDGVIAGCTFRSNGCVDNGGAIVATDDFLEVHRTVFDNNWAGREGAAVYMWSSKCAVFENCLFRQNRAGLAGGGLHFYSLGMLRVAGCTFVGNASKPGQWAGSPEGGTLSGEARDYSIVNTVFARNSGIDVVDREENSDIEVLACLFFGNSQGVYYNPTVGVIAEVNGPDGLDAVMPNASDNLTADPLFVNADAGNCRLTAGSPCIDTGTGYLAPDQDFERDARPSDMPGTGAEGTGTEYDIGYDEFVDTDGDGMQDAWERAHGFDPHTPDAASDADGDGLSNGEEYGYGTDPFSPDTDGDGIGDSEEILAGSDPSAPLREPVYVSLSGNNTTGDSWANALTSIGDGIALAAAEGKDVWVAAGNYNVASSVTMLSRVSVYGGFPATGSATFADRDPAVYVATIDGQGAVEHVVNGESVMHARFDGFTIRGGAGGDWGGGFRCNNGVGVVLADCVLIDNAATTAGGGACFYGSHMCEVRRCCFQNNTGDDGGGGLRFNGASGIVLDSDFEGNHAGSRGGGISGYASRYWATGCTFTGNTAVLGGGLDAHQGNQVTVTDCEFVLNESSDVGGALHFAHQDAVLVTGCEFIGNTAATRGGVVYSYGCEAWFEHCLLAANQAGDEGGGMYWRSSECKLLRCTVSNCSAPYGGGVFAYEAPSVLTGSVLCGNDGALAGGAVYASNTTISMVNCALTGNSSPSGGAAYYDAATADAVNCTIYGNEASSGGGVHGTGIGTLDIRNTLFAGNMEHAVYEEEINFDVSAQKCLFHGNPDGDFYDEGSTTYTGAEAMNLEIAGVSDCLDGDPRLAESGPGAVGGTWTAPPVYDALTNRTTLTASGAGFTPDGLAGCVVNPNTSQGQKVVVLSNTTGSVTVAGDLTGIAASGDTYLVADWRLRDASSALDRASLTAAPLDDFEGDERPGDDGKADIGADEAPGAYLPEPDLTAPVSAAESLPPYCVTPVFGIPYAASDTESGLAFVRLYYSKDGGPWTQYGGTYTSSPISFDAESVGGNGAYGFYTIAQDNAGNVEAAPGGPDASTQVEIYLYPPVSSVDVLPVLATDGVFNITFTASDPDSEVDYVRLFYRRDGGTWTQYGGHFDSGPIVFDTATTGGDGYYEFYVVATDTDGVDEAVPAGADTSSYVVTSYSASRIYVDQDATGAQRGDSWVTAYRRIEPALLVAAAYGVAEIWVAQGVYPEAVVLEDGVALYGGFAGGETALSERNITAHVTTIDASTADDGAPADHAVTMDSITNARLDGFVLTGGEANSTTNQDDNHGAGLYCRDLDDTNTAANCTITDNHCTGNNGWGGGVYCANSSMQFVRCTIRANSSTGAVGPGVYFGHGAPTMTHCVIEANYAAFSGIRGVGIYCAGGMPTFDHCVFAGNYGGVAGGGLYLNEATTSMSGCIVTQNDAGDGGGIFVRKGELTAFNCVIWGNLAGSGGALHCASTTAVNITNCTIANNQSSFWGYGAYVGGVSFSWSGGATFTNTTFTGNGNYAIYEGAAETDALLVNCHFHGNPDGDVYDEGTTAYTGAAAINAHVVGANNTIDGDPLFLAPAQGNFTLTEGSACTDAATPNGAPANDIIGVPRPQEAGYDIGAYEGGAHDSDGDGIPDVVEGVGDFDGDGTPDYLDTDSDSDGLPDALEGIVDTDNDAVPDYLDLDADGDGVLDSVEGTDDPDGDGVPNYLDHDSDGDGLTDADEALVYGSDPFDTDTDGDGWLDEWEVLHARDPNNPRNPSAGDLLWVTVDGEPGADIGLDAAAGADGSIYVAGTSESSPGCGGSSFVARSDPNGTVTWLKVAEGGMSSCARGVAAGPSQTVYITGAFTGTITLGAGEPNETVLVSDTDSTWDYSDIFIAKYAWDGSLIWARRAGSPAYPGDSGNDIAVLPDGSALVTGTFHGAAVFGEGEASETTLHSNGQSDFFVAKYDASGAFLGAMQVGGSEHETPYGITGFDDGSFAVAGAFTGSTIFGYGEASQTTLTSSGHEDAFVAKYTPTGSLVWARKAGASQEDVAYAVAALPDGGVAAIGRFWGTAEFNAGYAGAGTLTASSHGDAFIAGYDAGGALTWLRQAGGEGCQTEGFGITAMADGGTLITGRFLSMTSYTHQVVLGRGETNETTLRFVDSGADKMFVAQLDAHGGLVWARSAGCESLGVSGEGVAVCPDGDVAVTGCFFDTAVFAPGEPNETALQSHGLEDVFLARYACTALDSDGDGIRDDIEGTADADGDGIPNSEDLDSDGDGLPDAWENTHGLNPYDASGDDGADGDPDGDGVTNAEEWAAETDPVEHCVMWVDFAHVGRATGSWVRPFYRVSAAANAVAAGGTVKVKGDTAISETGETLRSGKAMRLDAVNGHVRIGTGSGG